MKLKISQIILSFKYPEKQKPFDFFRWFRRLDPKPVCENT